MFINNDIISTFQPVKSWWVGLKVVRFPFDLIKEAVAENSRKVEVPARITVREVSHRHTLLYVECRLSDLVMVMLLPQISANLKLQEKVAARRDMVCLNPTGTSCSYL